MPKNNLNSKKYQEKLEIIKTEEFFVSHVLSESQISQITVNLVQRSQEWGTPIINGKPFDDIYGDYNLSECHNGGLITKYVLDVEPKNKIIPIRKLYFEGTNLPLIGGTNIRAKIFKGEFDREKSFKKTFGRIPMTKEDMIPDYFEREYKIEESALEIMIYNGNKLINTSRSIQYKDFFKDSLF